MPVKTSAHGKRYCNLTLDAAKADYVKARLHEAGTSLSHMVRIYIDRVYETFKAMESGKDEMKASDVLIMITEVIVKMEKLEEAHKKGTKKP